jgi:hypothetical protein
MSLLPLQELAGRIAELEAEVRAAKRHRVAASLGAVDDGPVDGPNVNDAGAVLNPADLTLNDIKAWLMENGHEQKVWELTSGRAKKAEWVAYMRSALAA